MKIVWVVCLFLAFTFHGLSVEPVQIISKDSIDLKLDSLIEEFSFNKEVPKEFQSVFYTAIGYYPELKNVNIKVRYGNIKTTMQCRPRWDFIFHKKENRSYVIYIDQKIKNDYGVLFTQIPLNAQVGVMGHELAHIIDYSSLNNLQIAGFGLDYLKDEKKKHIENRVDLIAIERGLGYQINDFSKYVFEDSGASFDYINYKRKFYFRPSQIRDLIADSPIYFNNQDVLKD